MRRIRRALVIQSLAAAAVCVPLQAGVAAADVGDASATPASCMGVEAAALSPPGSSDEAPGGVPDIKAFVDEVAPGVPPGQAFFSVAARLHAGSHEACDEAFGE
jgi:hypothetical protein